MARGGRRARPYKGMGARVPKPVPLEPPPLPHDYYGRGAYGLGQYGWKPKPKTKAELEAELRQMEEELLDRKTEVKRLKDRVRSEEQMHDEVWIQDGRIWFRHMCNGAMLEQEVSQGWRISSSGELFPSFACLACSAHFFATVIVQLRRAAWSRPADFDRYPPWDRDWKQSAYGMRCSATTVGGKPCQNFPATGSNLCSSHKNWKQEVDGSGSSPSTPASGDKTTNQARKEFGFD